jgi:putative oxidoreductase
MEKTKVKHFVLWGLQIIAALAFLAAGTFKLIGAQQMVDVFQQIGVGQWFRYVTGTVEVVGGLALLRPATAGFGGLMLACTMFFATLTHVFVIGGSPLPALVLLIITSSIAWLRRAEIFALVVRQ